MDWNISMVKGDTLSFGVVLCADLDDTPFTDTLESASFSVKSSYDHTQMIFQKTLNDGFTPVGDGEYILRVAPEDTENVDAGDYYYDFEIGANGDRFTFLRGMLTIKESVTE